MGKEMKIFFSRRITMSCSLSSIEEACGALGSWTSFYRARIGFSFVSFSGQEVHLEEKRAVRMMGCLFEGSSLIELSYWSIWRIICIEVIQSLAGYFMVTKMVVSGYGGRTMGKRGRGFFSILEAGVTLKLVGRKSGNIREGFIPESSFFRCLRNVFFLNHIRN